jgi:hypothetical protein
MKSIDQIYQNVLNKHTAKATLDNEKLNFSHREISHEAMYQYGKELIKKNEELIKKKEEVLEALNSLLNTDLEKYSQTTGCPMCDNGVLRNPEKEHWENCNWNNARIIYERILNK